MDNRLPILKELMNISQLMAEINPVTPYKTPEGYFDGFAAKLMDRIRSMDTSVKAELESLSPLLSSIDKKTPYTTPEGYFNDLSDNLVSGLRAVDFVKEELDTPLLQELKHRNVYTVPAGYFESFPSHLMERINPASQAPVIRMNPVRKVFQYAVAATVTAIVAVGVFFFSRQSQPASLLASVPADSIASQNISKLSDEAIENYIANEIVLTADNNFMITGAAEIDEEDMRVMLTDIPIEELNRYVEMHGGVNSYSN